jgi:hypothetical protein
VTPEIKDPEVLMLAAIAGALKGDYVREWDGDPWAGSPFAWIRTRPSRQVGKIGEQLLAGWCAAKGLDITSSGDSEADRVIAGRRVEIKFSTLWRAGSTSSGSFGTHIASSRSGSASRRSTRIAGSSRRPFCASTSSAILRGTLGSVAPTRSGSPSMRQHLPHG